jgi:ornithine carbamoyltransferase
MPALLLVPQWLRLAEAAQAASQHLRSANTDTGSPLLQGCHVALLLPRDAGLQTNEFEGVAQAMGARLALLDSTAWLREANGHLSEAAQVLGRLYNMVDCCGLAADTVAAIDASAGVPVVNGLALESHPIYLLADLLAASNVSGLPLERLRLCIQGDEATALYRAAQAAAQALGIVTVDAAQLAEVPMPALSCDDPLEHSPCDFVLDTQRRASRGRLQAASGGPIQTQRLNQATAHYRRGLMWALMQGLLK